MVGQGRPQARITRTNTTRHSALEPKRLARMLVFWCALLSVAPCFAAEPLDLQMRVSWGNGERRLWRGSISLSEGLLSSPRCLGIEADAPDRFQIQDKTFHFQQRSPMSFDGFDLQV